MKKTLSNMIVITFQLAIVVWFFVICFLGNDNFKENESVVKNNNLDKVATSVSLLFEEENEIDVEKKFKNVEINDLPSINVIKDEDTKDVLIEEEEEEESVPLVSVDASKYLSNDAMGFLVTEGNKEYKLDGYEFDVVVAVVSSEFDKNLNDALAVTSVILNRCDSKKWSSWGGSSPYNQVIRKGQFEVYSSGAYLKYMPNGSNYGSVKYDIAKQAVLDGLNGIRNNEYLGFRAWWVSNYSDKYIVSGGNRYGYN